MKEIIKPAIVLLILCFVTVAAVATVSELTKERIEVELRLMAQETYMKTAFPGGEDFEMESLEVVDEQRKATIIQKGLVYDDNESIGHLYVVAATGYGGVMEVYIGINHAGEVVGVKVGENRETPGIIADVNAPAFLDQFIGKTGPNIVLTTRAATADHEIDSVSGATVSCRTITDCVNAALDYHKQRGDV